MWKKSSDQLVVASSRASPPFTQYTCEGPIWIFINSNVAATCTRLPNRSLLCRVRMQIKRHRRRRIPTPLLPTQSHQMALRHQTLIVFIFLFHHFTQFSSLFPNLQSHSMRSSESMLTELHAVHIDVWIEYTLYITIYVWYRNYTSIVVIGFKPHLVFDHSISGVRVHRVLFLHSFARHFSNRIKATASEYNGYHSFICECYFFSHSWNGLFTCVCFYGWF